MKVVQITPGRFHHFDLARELHRRGYHTDVYSAFPRWKLRDHGEERELPPDRIHTFPWFQTPYMFLAKYFGRYSAVAWLQSKFGEQVLKTLDSHVAKNLPDCDVLVGQSSCGLSSGRLARLRGGKFICDRGSSDIRYQNAILTDEYRKRGEQYVFSSPSLIAREEQEYDAANIITVPSQFALQSFVEMGVLRSKLRKVPYGVNLERFHIVGAPPLDRFEVLFVGGLNFRKGLPYLLEAFRKFSHPGKRLTLVGIMSAEMRRYFSRYPPDENVTLRGHVQQSQLKIIMSQSHVMVLPSLEEGLALVQAQALACGCPVIGTYNTGASDLFSNGVEGFIVPPRDPNSICDRLQLLADNPDLRQEMSRKAVETVKAIGGWSAYGGKFAAVLEELRCGKGVATDIVSGDHFPPKV